MNIMEQSRAQERRVGGLYYTWSTTPGMQLDAIVPCVNAVTLEFTDRRVPFGRLDEPHYFDQTGLLDTSLNHYSKAKRRRFLAETKGRIDIHGRLTADNPLAAVYHERRVLWGANAPSPKKPPKPPAKPPVPAVTQVTAV